MKFLVLSDLHLEFGSFEVPQTLEYDAVILAGDIHCPGHEAVHWACRDSVFGTKKPIILVPGNHEFYGRCMQAELREMREAAAGTNVHVMDRDEVVWDSPDGGRVRVLGATLWTDFALPMKVSGYRYESDVQRALADANKRLNDFRLIDVEYDIDHPREKASHAKARRHLIAEDTVALHWIDRSWLLHKLAEPFDGATVVVTHHAPSKESVAARFERDWLTPAFVSDLPEEFFGTAFDGPCLWVHGHTHTSFDYRRKGCRIVSNPRGYPLRNTTFENPRFDPGLIVVLEASPTSVLEQGLARLSDDMHGDEMVGRLADEARNAAERASASVDEAIAAVDASNKRMETTFTRESRGGSVEACQSVPDPAKRDA